MDRSKIDSMTTINEAHIMKRFVAAFLDMALAVFLFFLLSMTLMTSIANKAMGYSDLSFKYSRYQVATHLFMYQQANADSTVSLIEVKDYEKAIDPNTDSKIISIVDIDTENSTYILNHVRYYYLSYLTGKDVEMPESSTKTYDMVADCFVSPNYEKKVGDSDKLPIDYYTEEYFNNSILKVNEDGKDLVDVIDGHASFKEGVDEAAALKYIKNIAYSAQKMFYYEDYIQDLQTKAKWIQVFIFIPPYVFVMLLVYLLFPMIFKNGETLGKITMHLAVISKDGYRAKKRQIIFRFLVFFVEISLSLFIVGIGLASFITLGVGILILLVATLISKRNRSPHDYAALTVVIDGRTSVWFDDAKSEQSHVDEFNDNLSSYKEYKEINKNVIQVGGEIIDPTIKKEVEEARKKK